VLCAAAPAALAACPPVALARLHSSTRRFGTAAVARGAAAALEHVAGDVWTCYHCCCTSSYCLLLLLLLLLL
jgi:hypothetical protein